MAGIGGMLDSTIRYASICEMDVQGRGGYDATNLALGAETKSRSIVEARVPLP